MRVVLDDCPDCGEELVEVTGYPEDHGGRCRVYAVCFECGYEEDLGLADGVA